MKKILSIAVLMTLITGASLFAQRPPAHVFQDSAYHYFNVPIERIYAHRLGFVVFYQRGGGSPQLARAFIPQEWFQEPRGRGQFVRLGAGAEWPSMSVFFREGEFSHVRLRVRANRSHATWGVVPLHANIDEFFEGIEEIRLEF